MKFTSSLIICALMLGSSLNAQKSCCQAVDLSAQALASNASFKSEHHAPNPFVLESPKGKMITFKAADGTAGSAYVVPSKKPSNKVLFVFHEWWGLNDYIKQEAEKWQQELGDVSVYAVDLYDGKVATSQEEAAKYMAELDANHGRAIVEGLVTYVGKGKSIATIGWCLGGTWSFEAAILAGTEAKGCVMYYGFPEEDAAKVKSIQTDVLYIHGSQDAYISREVVDALGVKVKASGYKMKIVSYDAVHAFANPSNPKFNEYAASEAHYEASKFLKQAYSK